MSWGLYVFLNEIDVGYIYGGKAALCTGQMEWAVLHTNLNGLISTHRTEGRSCGKNGLLWCVCSSAHLRPTELALGDGENSELTDSFIFASNYGISTTCFSHLLFNCQRAGFLINTFPVLFVTGGPWICECLLYRWTHCWLAGEINCAESGVQKHYNGSGTMRRLLTFTPLIISTNQFVWVGKTMKEEQTQWPSPRLWGALD